MSRLLQTAPRSRGRSAKPWVSLSLPRDRQATERLPEAGHLLLHVHTVKTPRITWRTSVRSAVTSALALVALAACHDQVLAPIQAPEHIDAQTQLVVTPSGAVFSQEEWNSFTDKSVWLEPMEERIKRTDATLLDRAVGIARSVVGNASPKILCHISAAGCH